MSKPRRPRKNIKKADKHQDDRAQENSERTNNSAIIAEIAPTPLKPKEANSEQAQRPKWKLALTWTKTHGWRILEGLGIAAGVIYAGVTYLQWRDLRHNFEIDQRAWLRFRYAVLKDTISETDVMNSWPLTVQNVGKSPAFHTLVNAQFEIVPKTAPPSLTFNRPHIQIEVSQLFPTDENTFSVPLQSSSNSIHNLSTEEIQDLNAGRSYLAMFAQVSYDDQFGQHWTRFCNWKGFTPNDTFSARTCIAWNEAGDGPPPQ